VFYIEYRHTKHQLKMVHEETQVVKYEVSKKQLDVFNNF
jgi:hypothetical protein